MVCQLAQLSPPKQVFSHTQNRLTPKTYSRRVGCLKCTNQPDVFKDYYFDLVLRSYTCCGLQFFLGKSKSNIPAKRFQKVWDGNSDNISNYIHELCVAVYSDLACATILRNPHILQKFTRDQFSELCAIIKAQLGNNQLSYAVLYAVSGKTKSEFDEVDKCLYLLSSHHVLRYNYDELRAVVSQFMDKEADILKLGMMVSAEFSNYCEHVDVKHAERISQNWDILNKNGLKDSDIQHLYTSNDFSEFTRIRLHLFCLKTKVQQLKIMYLKLKTGQSLYDLLCQEPRLFEVSLEIMGSRYTFLEEKSMSLQFFQQLSYCLMTPDQFCKKFGIDIQEFQKFMKVWKNERVKKFNQDIESEWKKQKVT
eukprot:TRINITY_DN1333_c1_g1_i8.p1 TRINITY_DN1333_c1_g1~~TRINITY_DN1333_c1_g1_i8.p1  ORF type:complete len:365 (-),score=8.05 TRINITY_DN1333_c1_g1_i8:938-2032(-)